MTSKCMHAVIAAVSAAVLTAPAQAADFYAGKTIEFTVGGDAGGGYDIYSRTIARHLPRYIPGNPGIVVKNMPGAGSAAPPPFSPPWRRRTAPPSARSFPGAVIGPLLEDRAEAAVRADQIRSISPPPTAARASAPPSYFQDQDLRRRA